MNDTNNGGIGFLGALTILFIGLKLTGYINWSWILVLSPILLPLVLAVTICLAACVAHRNSHIDENNHW